MFLSANNFFWKVQKSGNVLVKIGAGVMQAGRKPR